MDGVIYKGWAHALAGFGVHAMISLSGYLRFEFWFGLGWAGL